MSKPPESSASLRGSPICTGGGVKKPSEDGGSRRSQASADWRFTYTTRLGDFEDVGSLDYALRIVLLLLEVEECLTISFSRLPKSANQVL